jgi:hypothetical protein
MLCQLLQKRLTEAFPKSPTAQALPLDDPGDGHDHAPVSAGQTPQPEVDESGFVGMAIVTQKWYHQMYLHQ